MSINSLLGAGQIGQMAWEWFMRRVSASGWYCSIRWHDSGLKISGNNNWGRWVITMLRHMCQKIKQKNTIRHFASNMLFPYSLNMRIFQLCKLFLKLGLWYILGQFCIFSYAASLLETRMLDVLYLRKPKSHTCAALEAEGPLSLVHRQHFDAMRIDVGDKDSGSLLHHVNELLDAWPSSLTLPVNLIQEEGLEELLAQVLALQHRNGRVWKPEMITQRFALRDCSESLFLPQLLCLHWSGTRHTTKWDLENQKAFVTVKQTLLLKIKCKKILFQLNQII